MSGPLGFDFGVRASILFLLLLSLSPQTFASTQTVEARVSSSSDDAAEDASGVVGLDSAALELTFSSNEQVVGIRFIDLNIPADAIIGGVVRNDQSFIAVGDFRIKENDKVVIFSLSGMTPKLEKLFHRTSFVL